VTRWRDEDAFDAWMASPAFAHGHRSTAPSDQGGEGKPPVGVHSEVWSYVPVVQNKP
jgi:heme-degrading monooxygenase HmoA